MKIWKLALLVASMIFMGGWQNAILSDGTLLFVRSDGIWQYNGAMSYLWLANASLENRFVPVMQFPDGRVLIQNMSDGTLHTSPVIEKPMLTSFYNLKVLLGTPLSLSPDGQRLAYFGNDLASWYTIDLNNGTIRLMANTDIALTCGGGPRAPDSALLREERETLFLDWHIESLLAPTSCDEGVQKICPDCGEQIIDASLEHPRLSPDGQMLVGGYSGSLMLVNPVDGQAQTAHVDFIGDYAQWWWVGDTSLYFEIEHEQNALAVDRFPDETLAESFLGLWSPYQAGLSLYQVSLYRWDLDTNTTTQLWQADEGVRGIGTLTQGSDQLFFTVITSARPLIDALSQDLPYEQIEDSRPRSMIYVYRDGSTVPLFEGEHPLWVTY
jgi:hypothetical protein